MEQNTLIKPLHGLRGAAAMTVVIGHLAPVEGAAAFGVVLFFVLSGFLMGRLYLERPFGAEAAWKYAAARFARIYPLFALVIVATAAANSLLPQSAVFGLAPADVVPHLLLAGSAQTVWTISVECQFYALFLLIWWARQKFASSHYFVAAVLLAACIGAIAVGKDAGRIALLRYLHIFALGLAVAVAAQYRGALLERISGWALPGFVLAYGVAFFAIPHFYPVDFVYADPVAIAICGGLIMAAVAAPTSLTGRLLSLPPMLWLGEISFGTYLLHRPVEALVGNTVGALLPAWLSFLLMVALTLALAHVAHQRVEDPARLRLRGLGEWKRGWRQSRA